MDELAIRVEDVGCLTRWDLREKADSRNIGHSTMSRSM